MLAFARRRRAGSVLICLLVAPAAAQAVELASLAPPDLGAGDLFGAAAALSGTRVAIGVPGDDQLGMNLGALEIFRRRNDGTWVLDAKLVDTGATSGGSLGTAAALDGTRVLVARTSVGGSGNAHVYERIAGTWAHVGTIVPPGSFGYFARSVALDGDRALIGALSQQQGVLAGSAFVFERGADGVWTNVATLLASDGAAGHQFGHAVALDGDRALVGAWYGDGDATASGAAYVYERDGSGAWHERAKLAAGGANAHFGAAVALRGDRALVGAPNASSSTVVGSEGAAYVFDRALDGTWIQRATLQLLAGGGAGPFGQGARVALGDGTACVATRGDGVRATLATGALVWRETSPGAWQLEQALFASSAFGSAQEPSALAYDDERLVIADSLSDALGVATGSAHVFDLEPLSAAPGSISLSAGGVQTLSVDAGHLHAAEPYLVLGSASGTQPGLVLGGGLVLPLVVDPYFAFTLANPNHAPLSASFGLLSAGGAATCAFALPPGSDPALAGVVVAHAFVVIDVLALQAVFASNATQLALQP